MKSAPPDGVCLFFCQNNKRNCYESAYQLLFVIYKTAWDKVKKYKIRRVVG
jgi:hypothetical protein